MTGSPTQGAEPRLSLIVCTRNRSPSLDAFFDAISRMRCDAPWELVMVDNGSTDDTPARLQAFAAAAPTPVTIASEPRAGLGRARNAGVRHARGAIFAFTDDDCYPAEDYPDRVLEAFAETSLGFIGGRILLYDDRDHPITIRVDTDPIAIPPRSVVPTGLVQGANMAFRREVLERIGGFDNALGPGTPFCNDDVDAVARASAAGFAGSYVPEPVVYHHHRRSEPAEIKALWRTYDRGRGAYYAKCMLDLPTRARVARYWWQSIGTEKPGATLRELEGALDYCVRRLTRRLG
ncbi:MAG: glycosyltransferase family 2 protein [Gemmatimonadaceae bacterium]|nr:glycosyltransferase family 2 protein [Gemmatimonadaceae bacterium]